MHWFVTYDRKNKKACIDSCFNDSYLMQQVAELIDQGIPVNGNVSDASTTSKEILIQHIKDMDYEYVEYSIIEYYKNELEKQKDAESIKLYYKDYTRLEDNMNLEVYAKLLLLSFNEDFSDEKAKQIADKINTVLTDEGELLNDTQKDLVIRFMANESASDAHNQFVKTVKSMVKKEK